MMQRFAAVLAMMFCWVAAVNAQTFPRKPVRFVVGYAPGGGADVLTRIVGRKLSDVWGQPVVVENRAGAGGAIAASLVASAAPDGHTILMITSNHAVPSGENRQAGFDPVKSYAPVIEIAYIPSALLTNMTLAVTSVKELIAQAKLKPGALNFGSTGTNSAQYMDMLQWMQVTGTQVVNVTYKGAALILVALISNEVQLTLQPITAYLEAIRGGKLRALAVTGATRSRHLPTIPTYAEVAELKGFGGSANWYGIVAPAGTPKAIVRKLHDDAATVASTAEVQKLLLDQAFVPVLGSEEAFLRTIANDRDKWLNIIKHNKIN